MIRIAIVDDDWRLSRALKKELDEFPEIDSIQTADSGVSFARELQNSTPEARPHVIIMDISMGTPDEGVETTRKIKRLFPDIHIIMFTINDDDEMIFEAFKAGAMGYLLKNEKPLFIFKTIIDVMNGGAQMSPSIARKAIRFFSSLESQDKSELNTTEIDTLSVREIEILRQVEKGNTYDQIGALLFISANTVKKHMMNIFRKLQVNNKIEALKKAKGHFQ